MFDGLPIVTGPPWPGVRYFSTTRQGGSSLPPWSALNLGLNTGDSRAAVQANRRRLARALPGKPRWLEQVHGVAVQIFDDPDDETVPDTLSVPVADAAVTSLPDRVLAVLTADCLPVVIGSDDGRVLGVAHAGWRGLAAGVLENTLDALRDRFRTCHPQDALAGAPRWRAWIGPAISQCHFEVGEDVRQSFVGADPQTSRFFQPGLRPGKWYADLLGIAHHRLARQGVAHIDLSGVCTWAAADRFYSYRKSPVTGRFATLAWRDASAWPDLTPDYPD